ncbi:hypothetical protein J1614_011149 [Plenodomus biglobosus]|nr:hypothetical protein J1614_011149 [Plenodomus biglobosus]
MDGDRDEELTRVELAIEDGRDGILVERVDTGRTILDEDGLRAKLEDNVLDALSSVETRTGAWDELIDELRDKPVDKTAGIKLDNGT